MEVWVDTVLWEERSFLLFIALLNRQASSRTATNARVRMSTTICESITGLETPGRLVVL